MKALLGQKVGMSRIFSAEGEAVPVTLISCTPNEIVLQRTADRDGRDAVQLGLKRDNYKPAKEQDKSKKFTPGKLQRKFAARREFFVKVEEKVSELTVAQFEVGDVVEVVGVSKGKGFQGVVKRHGFKGGPASHGHRHVLRKPGSIGSAFPQHVMKGKKMAGRMGADRVKVKNLEVMWVDADKNVLAVKGAVPGRRGSTVEIRLVGSE